MRILAAFDKFKGSLSAVEACRAAARGFQRVSGRFAVCQAPVADGGEGTVEAAAASLGGSLDSAKVEDALGNSIDAAFFIAGSGPGCFAVLEMAAAAALTQIPENLRDPLRSSTRGVGLLMHAAQREGAQTIFVGLGGSATNDGGAGMASAYGYAFLDDHNLALDPIPANLTRVACIVPPLDKSAFPKVIALADVVNPLLGPEGATAVFGPQKGVTPGMLPLLEAALAHLAGLAASALGRDYSNTPGAGAAGGLGFGLLTFLDAAIEPGFERLAQLTGLREKMESCDCVITGEGRADRQTLYGKAPAGVAALARNVGRPVHLVAGSAVSADLPLLEEQFDTIRFLQAPHRSHEEAVANASRMLEEACAELARELLRNREM